ncbi:MAG TPA: hypothetical protein VJB92_01840 [Candidatus Paceibacterota bacterium]
MISHKRRKNLRGALLITGVLSFAAVLISYLVQKRSESRLGIQCSYFDPPLIDILAFSAALFLICEGLYQILEYHALSSKDKIFVAIRVAFGFAILTLHFMQFIYK